jgi:hypothetical protein
MSTYKIYDVNGGGGTGKSGNWFKESFRFTGTHFDLVSENDSQPRTRKSGSWSVDATDPTLFLLHFECPGQPDGKFGFTASATTLTIFLGTTVVATYVVTQ